MKETTPGGQESGNSERRNLGRLESAIRSFDSFHRIRGIGLRKASQNPVGFSNSEK